MKCSQYQYKKCYQNKYNNSSKNVIKSKTAKNKCTDTFNTLLNKVCIENSYFILKKTYNYRGEGKT